MVCPTGRAPGHEAADDSGGSRFSDCTFDDAAWHPPLLVVAGLDASQLPANWRAAITLPAPPYLRQAYECRYLRTLSTEQDAKRGLIIKQAVGIDEANQRVQEVIGPLDSAGASATHDALRLLYNNLDAPLYYFKRLFRRGRPVACCDGISLVIKPEDDNYPKHPAYPSGHATKAYALAYFYARLFPARSDQLMAEAADVGRNREVAGLHYPSDTVAGQLLAAQLVDMLFLNDEFQRHAARVPAEWPNA